MPLIKKIGHRLFYWAKKVNLVFFNRDDDETELSKGTIN